MITPTKKETGPGHGMSQNGLMDLSVEHYLLMLGHRKWLILSIFLIVSAVTVVWSYRMPNIYSSETLILVDPQKVPDSYVTPTITGSVRNRLGTLSQQILSATRLQTVIDKFNLYAESRAKQVPREDIINRMRAAISVNVVSDFGASQDLQAFRIAFNGIEPRVVAQVTNELASLFIEENLKAREQQATGTEEFIGQQLEENKLKLEAQETQLRDFKLKHIGEMPEQQTVNLQILGQYQSQLQMEIGELNRAEQQKSYIQSMMAQSSVLVLDLDTNEQKTGSIPDSPARNVRAMVSELLTRYGEEHPDVRRLRKQIEEEDQARAESLLEAGKNSEAPDYPKTLPVPVNYINPVLQSQFSVLDEEIAKRKIERTRLQNLVGVYQRKLEAIPIREQEIADLVRDYQISKAHYLQLLQKKYSAEMATDLEIRQKGEKFSILDPAQVPEKPSAPNRKLINSAGSLGGLGLGLFIALFTELFGMTITSTRQITAVTGIAVLGVIPIIRTQADRLRRKRLVIAGAASGLVTMLVLCAVLLYHFRDRVF